MRARLVVFLTFLGTAVWAETPKAQLTKEGEALFKKAEAAKKQRNYEVALINLERCIAQSPGHYPCYRLLGTVRASLAVRDNSSIEQRKAREAYEQYVAIAPADDEYVPKVKVILEQAPAR